MRPIKALLAVLFLALCASSAPAALAVVQFAHGGGAASVPGNVVLGSAPTVGDLIVAEVLWNRNQGTPVPNAASYTQLGLTFQHDTSFDSSFTVVRYVQNGDTATLPALASSGSTLWGYVAWEISGVSGTLAKDVQIVGGSDDVTTNDPLNYPFQVPQTAGTIVLATGGNNFGSYTCDVPASWVADVNTGAQSGWGGTLCGLRRSGTTAGTAISAWSATIAAHVAASTPQVIVTPSIPTYPYVRQSFAYACNSSSTGGACAYNLTPLLQTAPIAGNLDIAFVDLNGLASPTVGAGWTQFAINNTGGTVFQLGLYRYVQNGDTVSLPAFVTSSSTAFNWGYNVYELGGVAGNWAADFQSVKNGRTSGATVTTTADTTLQPNTLALVGELMGVSNAAELTFGGSWANDTNDGSSNYAGAEQFFGTKGSSVQSTMTPPASTTVAWIQVLLGAAPATKGGGFFHAFP